MCSLSRDCQRGVVITLWWICTKKHSLLSDNECDLLLFPSYWKYQRLSKKLALWQTGSVFQQTYKWKNNELWWLLLHLEIYGDEKEDSAMDITVLYVTKDLKITSCLNICSFRPGDLMTHPRRGATDKIFFFLSPKHRIIYSTLQHSAEDFSMSMFLLGFLKHIETSSLSNGFFWLSR